MAQLIGHCVRFVLSVLLGAAWQRRRTRRESGTPRGREAGQSSVLVSVLAALAVAGTLTLAAYSRVAVLLRPTPAFFTTGAQQDPPDCTPVLDGPCPPVSDPGPCIGPEGGPAYPTPPAYPGPGPANPGGPGTPGPGAPTTGGPKFGGPGTPGPGAPGGGGGRHGGPATIGPDLPGTRCAVTRRGAPDGGCNLPIAPSNGVKCVGAGPTRPPGGSGPGGSGCAPFSVLPFDSGQGNKSPVVDNPAPEFTDPSNVARVGVGEFQQFFAGSVDVATRAFRWGEIDYEFQGVTPEATLIVGRRYVSDLNFDGVGSVGQDWVSTLYDRIFVVDSVTLRHVDWNAPYNDPSFYFPLVDAEDGIDCPICGSNPYLNIYEGNPVNGEYIEEHTGPQPGNSHYVLHERDGSQRDYDTSGRIIDKQDRYGNKITYSYDSSGHLATLVDSVGRTFVVTTNTGGRITKIEFQDPSSGAKTRLVSYTYTSGKLTQVTRANRIVGTWNSNWNYSETTRTTQAVYVYDASGFLVGMEDDAGDVTLSITYDSGAPGKVISQTAYPNPSDSTTWGTWSYSRIGNTTTVVDPRDFKTEYDVAPGTNQVIAARRFITNLGTNHESRTIPPGHAAFYLYTFDRDTTCNCGGPIKKLTQPEGGAFQFAWIVTSTSPRLTRSRSPDPVSPISCTNGRTIRKTGSPVTFLRSGMPAEARLPTLAQCHGTTIRTIRGGSKKISASHLETDAR